MMGLCGVEAPRTTCAVVYMGFSPTSKGHVVLLLLVIVGYGPLNIKWWWGSLKLVLMTQQSGCTFTLIHGTLSVEEATGGFCHRALLILEMSQLDIVSFIVISRDGRVRRGTPTVPKSLELQHPRAIIIVWFIPNGQNLESAWYMYVDCGTRTVVYVALGSSMYEVLWEYQAMF